MTQEEKDILFKDLCCRIPYGVKVKIQYYDDVCELQAIYSNGTTYATRDIEHHIETYFEECKPYLFPLSSMTKEQEIEFFNTCVSQNPLYWTLDTFKWLNKNHFDYNYLIDNDLAIDAIGLDIY